MKIAASIAIAFAVIAAAGGAFVYSGVYDIGATSPHFELTQGILRAVMERSVRRQARDVNVPELDDPEKVHTGFTNFHAMCVTCHGAPGSAASEIGKGLYPQAPDLAQAAKRWTPAELYVIVKRGIKMSGMPAWEPTHSGEELWGLVAFLKLLPTMPAAEYQAAVEYYAKNAANPGKHGGGHMDR